MTYSYINTVYCFHTSSVGLIKSAVKANSRNTNPPIMVTKNNKNIFNYFFFLFHYYTLIFNDLYLYVSRLYNLKIFLIISIFLI